MANQYVSKVVLGNGTTLMDLTSDTVSADKVLSGITAHDKSGAPITGTCTFDSDTSDDTAAVSEVLASKTFHARGSALTGTMPNRGGVTGTISAVSGSGSSYTIPQGYHDGSGSVSLGSTFNLLIPANIRENITIGGVTGTMSGSEDISAQAVNVTPSFSAQTITPDSTQGYNVLSQVNVAAISVVYSDNSAGGQTVTIG